jgi:hypothetical protein
MPQDISAKIDKGNLIITIPMNTRPVPSATGKTLVVASSRGNKETELQVDGERVIVGVNAYIRQPKR